MTADERRGLIKKLLFIPAALIGVAAIIYAMRNPEPPEMKPPEEAAVAARTIAAPSVAVVPRALAYGTAQPAAVWQAVAEVAGKIVEIHPDLKNGAILPAGAVILRIDPTDYRLALARLEANVRDMDAKLAELAIREDNTRQSLEIEERSLALSRKEVERKRVLLKRGNVTQTAVDEEERSMLARQQSVQSLQNTLNLVPAERESLGAQMAVTQSQLQDAELDLERTTITAPFDGRVAEVMVERAQFANSGQVLAVLDDIATTEVTAQLPIDKMMTLVSSAKVGAISPDRAMQVIREELAIEPIVRLYAGDTAVEWTADLVRISDTIDPQSRTVGVIVAVADPYRKAQPGVRPPLAKNMYVEVELRGRPRDPSVVLPRAALHDGVVFVLDAENRLRRRPVEIAFVQTGFVALAGGLEADERVVVSDLIPAIEGMLIASEDDPAALRALIDQATGKGSVR